MICPCSLSIVLLSPDTLIEKFGSPLFIIRQVNSCMMCFALSFAVPILTYFSAPPQPLWQP